MPRTAQANEVLRSKSRERILNAAVRLFARRGFGGTTVRAIAEEAGVALGMLYAHFKSKEAVLFALMQDSVFDVNLTIDEAAQEPSAEGFAKRLLRAAIAALDRHRDAWRLSYALRHQPEVLKVQAKQIGAYAGQIQKRLAAELAGRGVPNAKVEAHVLFAMVDGIAQRYALELAGFPVDAVIRAAAARYAGFERRRR
jgi:AcrR family transcriptional regulator